MTPVSAATMAREIRREIRREIGPKPRCMRLPPLEGEFDQPRDQLGVGDARRLPELGVGARHREAGQGIDRVDEHARLPLDEELHAGEPGAVDGAEGLDRDLAYAPGYLGAERRRYLEGRVPGAAVGLVVVPLARVADLAG